MAHEKVYGYCENLCNVEVSPKTKVEAIEDNVETRELKSNKVTSISSSSTDSQYPSAKCMYSRIASLDNTTEKTSNKTPLINSSSTEGQYPTAKAVYDKIMDIGSRLLIGSQVEAFWKNTPDGECRWYFYEGSNTSQYDLPSSNCCVVVFKKGANRGVAFAFGWTSSSNAVWHNNLHDTWKGWTSLHS